MYQSWEDVLGRQLCVCRNFIDKKKDTLVLFLPGLGHTKAGPYFMYSEIAQSLNESCDTVQFDYYGFGDSSGYLEECELSMLIDECKYFCNKYTPVYKTVYVISCGFSNSIANSLVDWYSNVFAILIDPSYESLKEYEAYKSILRLYREGTIFLDTSEIYEEFNDTGKFFMRLGDGYNRCKGLYTRCKFLLDICDSYTIHRGKGKLFICQSHDEGELSYNCFVIPCPSIQMNAEARQKLMICIENIINKFNGTEIIYTDVLKKEEL